MHQVRNVVGQRTLRWSNIAKQKNYSIWAFKWANQLYIFFFSVAMFDYRRATPNSNKYVCLRIGNPNPLLHQHYPFEGIHLKVYPPFSDIPKYHLVGSYPGCWYTRVKLSEIASSRHSLTGSYWYIVADTSDSYSIITGAIPNLTQVQPTNHMFRTK